MIVFLNGQFVPEEKARVSVFDRSFQFGDGLFETLAVFNGKPFRWQEHVQRLEHGADFLRIQLPFTDEEMEQAAHELIQRNKVKNGVLRLHLSRGVGLRGYSPKGADKPMLILTVHASPKSVSKKLLRWKLITSSVRVAENNALSIPKTANKLTQIVACQEADDAGANDAVLLNTAGQVAETTRANIFWIEKQTILTPPLASGALTGVTRSLVFELCQAQGVRCAERKANPVALRKSDGVFLTMSTLGIVEVGTLDGVKVKHSPLTRRLQHAYWQTVLSESK